MVMLRALARAFSPKFSRALIFFSGLLVASMAAAGTNGFTVRFTSEVGKSADTMVVPNLWLYVGEGQPASPFIPPGKFTAEFRGSIHAELRGTYVFKAERIKGAFKLEINGTNVYSATGEGSEAQVSAPAQLNKGANPVRALFTSGAGEAFLRVGWAERGTNVNPIPDSLISHAPHDAIANQAISLHLGRELFIEHRCIRCHTAAEATLPELALDAPTFDGIGARLNARWMADWIADPKGSRASVQMPRTFHGANAKQEAEAIAAYLASLVENQARPADKASRPSSAAIAEIERRSGPNAKPTLAGEVTEPADHSAAPKPLFHRLQCNGCHDSPDAKTNDLSKIALKHVSAKFKQGQLAEFLEMPERHFTWIRMPNFKLAAVEAKELAEFLLKHSDTTPGSPIGSDKTLIDRGRKLVQSSGCLNCHSARDLKNEFTAPALAKVRPAEKGCLAAARDGKSATPDYGFDLNQREALIGFLRHGTLSLSRHSSMEYSARQATTLQCNGCHGKVELVPPLEALGGKLKPEWTAAFLAGYPYKVRADIHPRGGDWIPARMPSFPARARLLAEGMAAQHGFAPITPPEPPVDEAAAAIGHKMIGKENGLSCISCHAVNDAPALEVFESEGTNLGLVGDRLLKPWFFRWMRNPLSIDPQSKMPAFFNEEGQSALTDYYGGDAEKQIHALYEYMRLGTRMQKPGTGGQ